MHIEDADACQARDRGSARTLWPRCPWPGPVPRRPHEDMDAGCAGPSGCWYRREGYARCHDHSDGTCILARRVRA